MRLKYQLSFDIHSLKVDTKFAYELPLTIAGLRFFNLPSTLLDVNSWGEPLPKWLKQNGKKNIKNIYKITCSWQLGKISEGHKFYKLSDSQLDVVLIKCCQKFFRKQ